MRRLGAFHQLNYFRFIRGSARGLSRGAGSLLTHASTLDSLPRISILASWVSL
jgi:hypothetical protein